MNREHLGIDFGTTRTVVSAAVGGNYPILSFVDEDGDATEWYPSIIAVRDQEVRFGLHALKVADDPDWTVARSFKRWLSRPDLTPDTTVTVAGITRTAQQWLTDFLKELRKDLHATSNLPESLRRAESIPAVIATPANARSAQRLMTLEAFQSAGFEVLSMLNEPSAAGIEYAYRHRNTLTSRREHVLVYDLGGGTFDASLVRMQAHRPEVMASAGVARLGGDDFDEVLLDMTLERLGIEREQVDPPCLRRLRNECREQKERLHPNTRKLIIDLEQVWGKDAPAKDVTIAATEFYERCQPLIEHTLQVVQTVFPAPPTSLSETGGTLPGVAGLYVVGGASSLPAVLRQLRERFGRRVHRSPYLSGATAIGLAIAGDKARDLKIADRFTRTFGVFREMQGGAKVSFDPIFLVGTKLPAPGQGPITATRRYRSAHNVGHFRYVECDDVTEDGNPVGTVTPFARVVFPFDPALRRDDISLRDVPVRRLDERAGTLVEERYALDENGMVRVSIISLEDGYEREYFLGQQS